MSPSTLDTPERCLQRVPVAARTSPCHPRGPPTPNCAQEPSSRKHDHRTAQPSKPPAGSDFAALNRPVIERRPAGTAARLLRRAAERRGPDARRRLDGVLPDRLPPGGRSRSRRSSPSCSPRSRCVAHDLAHRQVFRTKRPSELAGLVAGEPRIGMSYGWWMDKHTRHHTNPNHDDLDPDVAPGVLIWSAERPGPAGLHGFITRHQACLFFPLLTLLGARPAAWPASGRCAPATMKRRGLEASLLVVHTVAVPGRAVRGAVARCRPWRSSSCTRRCSASTWAARSRPTTRACRHPGRRRGLPAQAGADLAQRARRLAGRHGAGRPQLPDRAPPVPRHADARTCAGPSRSSQAYCAEIGVAYVETGLVELLRAGAAPPARGGRAAPRTSSAVDANLAKKPWSGRQVIAHGLSTTPDTGSSPTTTTRSPPTCRPS